MDLSTIPFGAYAIAGSVLIALFALIGHWITQRNENIRNMRKLAYEAAITEWKTENELFIQYQDKHGAFGHVTNMRLDDYILGHLALVDELSRIDITRASAEDLAPVIRRGRNRDMAILRLRQELETQVRVVPPVPSDISPTGTKQTK